MHEFWNTTHTRQHTSYPKCDMENAKCKYGNGKREHENAHIENAVRQMQHATLDGFDGVRNLYCSHVVCQELVSASGHQISVYLLIRLRAVIFTVRVAVTVTQIQVIDMCRLSRLLIDGYRGRVWGRIQRDLVCASLVCVRR